MPAKTTLPRVNLFSLDLLYTVCPDWENTIVKGHWQLARQVHRWHTAPALFDHPGGTFPALVANLCKVRVSQHKWFLRDESNRASFTGQWWHLVIWWPFHKAVCIQERCNQYSIQSVRQELAVHEENDLCKYYLLSIRSHLMKTATSHHSILKSA